MERVYRVVYSMGTGIAFCGVRTQLSMPRHLFLWWEGFLWSFPTILVGRNSEVTTTEENRSSTSNRVSRDVSAGGSDGSDQVSRRRHRQVEQASGVARELGNIIR